MEAPRPEPYRLFCADREATFLRRPNRFLIVAESRGEELLCHCPNPGRILEFALPGTPLILEARRDQGGLGAAPKTAWTAAAVRYGSSIVPLAPGRMNGAVGALALPALFPDLSELRPEYSLGSSRFDFWGREAGGREHLIEVKTCSLVEEGLGLFPDAPSARATRHLEELEELSRAGYRCHVVFAIAHGNPRALSPNPHTDPRFATTMARIADAVDLRAVLFRCAEDGTLTLRAPRVPLDLDPGRLAAEDRGSYLVALHLEEGASLEVGALGHLDLPPGWYVYAGSAQKHLKARVARHLRKVRKGRHWHLDYLTPYADRLEGYPIAGRSNLECSLASALRGIGGHPIPGFGSTDCGCPSHLYRFGGPPHQDRGFVRLLLEFRHRRAFE